MYSFYFIINNYLSCDNFATIKEVALKYGFLAKLLGVIISYKMKMWNALLHRTY